MSTTSPTTDRRVAGEAALRAELAKRIVLVDGAMGSLLQGYGFDEAGFRGERLADHPAPLVNNSDVLSLTQPQAVKQSHAAYLAAGADIIETNTFGATRIAQADFEAEALVHEMNVVSARLAREAADEAMAADDGRWCWVAGSIGPTNKTCSLSPRVEDPGFRDVTFDELVEAYQEQALALIEGGVDLLMPETAFDTLNLKAALYAIEEAFEQVGFRLPVIASGTLPGEDGRTLSGQTVEALYASLAHADLLAISLNCALGADKLRPHVEALSELAAVPVACIPNAGMPNELAEYDQTPEEMAALMAEFAAAGWLNLAGGCCGSTPAHIQAIREALEGIPPRVIPEPPTRTLLSGLEPLWINPESNLIMVGERTNVTGSKRFSKLIAKNDYDKAVEVAISQVEGGANVIDVCMDAGLLDGPRAIKTFLDRIAAEPDVARVPVMIDSSDWDVIEAGLRCLQGKGIVNSISLKEGEAVFLEHARRVRRFGAAVVVMGFDETGQAETVEHKVAIAERAYKLLTEQAGFAPDDIIFDPNVLAIGTGIEEHNDYAVAFVEATRQIKQRFPRVHVSGGISNISFAFRGNDAVREAMHACFLYEACKAGLDMAIVNAGQLADYDELPAELKTAVEDVLWNRREDATERLLEMAETVKNQGGKKAKTADLSWREGTLEERVRHAVISGIHQFITQDMQEALDSGKYAKPLEIIEGPLMAAMDIVGDRFGSGKMFLPQVVKSARVMKAAVAHLEPYMERDEAASRGTVVLATVKGDVHDIGKNIVGVVLACNGYRIVDKGVMVPTDEILSAARHEGADMIGLSGLITPSLGEMVRVAQEMERRELKLPLLIGGATTSAKHTAVKVAPMFHGAPVIHVADASRAVGVVSDLLGKDSREQLAADNKAEQDRLREAFLAKEAARNLLPFAESCRRAQAFTPADVPAPQATAREQATLPLAEVREHIDWTPFFHAWELKGVYPRILDDKRVGERARELFDDAQRELDAIVAGELLECRAVHAIWPASREGEDIVIYDAARSSERARFFGMRQQFDREVCLSLADFIAPADQGEDHLGGFVVTAGIGLAPLVQAAEAEGDDYRAILLKALADRLAEASAELLHKRVRARWGIEEELTIAELLKSKFQGIRPAPGYPAQPDHTEKRTLFELLDAGAIGVELTESCAMTPAASVSGLVFAHPGARYFAVGTIGRDQLESYCERKGWTVSHGEGVLAHNL